MKKKKKSWSKPVGSRDFFGKETRFLQELLQSCLGKCRVSIQTAAQTARVNRNIWVENADRLVAGFLEMFEEGCHKMGTAIRDRIQEQIMATGNMRGLVYEKEGDDDVDYYYDDSTDEEYYDNEDEE
ncbi:unnamed protein product [Ilex paraguariensis]|uniref:Uncharacterized protein n=1 Tax=Ilex paraguariensis TaxID=185542 RepID=A0ABC8SHS2_9AQUA